MAVNMWSSIFNDIVPIAVIGFIAIFIWSKIAHKSMTEILEQIRDFFKDNGEE